MGQYDGKWAGQEDGTLLNSLAAQYFQETMTAQIKELAPVAASIAEGKKEEMTVLITTAIAFIAILLAEHWFF